MSPVTLAPCRPTRTTEQRLAEFAADHPEEATRFRELQSIAANLRHLRELVKTSLMKAAPATVEEENAQVLVT